MKKILLFFYVGIAFISLTGCESELFTQLFRNPHIVDVAKLDEMTAGQWYEFKTDIRALHRIQSLQVIFDGSEPSKLKMSVRGPRKIGKGGIFTSSSFPNKEIRFEVLIIDSDKKTYLFETGGQSRGLLFYHLGDENLKGKLVTKVKIKANLNHRNIKVLWTSYTGK